MKIEQSGSHLNHLIRQTRQHHVQLGSMADLKANILMTIASVVITLSVRHTMERDLKWTAMTLNFFSLITILPATSSMIPKIPFPLRPGIPEPRAGSGFNLLFFCDVTQVKHNEFSDDIQEEMNDPSKSYETQLKEIDTLGEYLARKQYRYSRLASTYYSPFIMGLCASGVILLITGFLS